MDWNKIKAKDFDVTYTDVMKPFSKSYGHPGKYICTEKQVSLQPESGHLTVLVVFACVFLSAYSLGAYLFCSPPEKWGIMIGGTLLGGFTFAAIYLQIKYQIDAGPYIVYDRTIDQILLPRIDKSFQRNAVSLQWITGRCEHHDDIHTDLNLIVEEDGNLNRYFVMGGPSRRYVKNFVEEANVPVIEINTRWRGRRDLDVRSKP